MVLSTSDTLNWLTQSLFIHDITASWSWLTGGTVLATIVGSFFLILNNRNKCKQFKSQINLAIPIGVKIIFFNKIYKNKYFILGWCI